MIFKLKVFTPDILSKSRAGLCVYARVRAEIRRRVQPRCVMSTAATL